MDGILNGLIGLEASGWTDCWMDGILYGLIDLED